MSANAEAISGTPTIQSSRAYAGYVLILLTVVNVSSYMDRSVLSILAPGIKAEFGFSDTAWGAIAGIAFAIPYALAGIPLARLADRWSRRGVLALAISVWSGMTAICGTATNVTHLVLGRMGVGLGEAGCLPQGQGIVAGYYPAEKRAGAMAIHSAGIATGTMLGLIAGGWIGHEYGWRAAFLALGIPGLLLSLLVATTVNDPPAAPVVGPESAGASHPQGLWALIRARPSYFHLVMVFGSGAFFAAALHAWLPSYYVREYGLSLAQTGLSVGLANGVASVAGILLGGWVGNRLQKRGPVALIRFAIVTDLTTMALYVLVLLSSTASMSLGLNVLAAATGMMAHGILFSLVQGVAPDHLRSRAASLLAVASALVGMSGGPALVGILSDALRATAGDQSLRYALMAATAICLWPVFHFLMAARTNTEDTRST